MKKLIICIDFDGVVHDYMDGWQGETVIGGNAVPGFFDWAIKAREHFALVIYSSRSKTPEGIAAMKKWLSEQLGIWRKETVYATEGQADILLMTDDFSFAAVKPAAWLTIDDRALCFNGNWADRNFSVEAMRSFKPWNKPQ
jgi:hypothetical protein